MDRPSVATSPEPTTAGERPMAGLGRQGLLNAGATVLPGVYLVAATGAIIQQVGAAGYAPWALAVVLLGWLTLLDLGLAQTVVRASARAAAGAADAVGDVLAAGWAYAGLGLVAGLGGLVVALLVPRILGLSGADASDATTFAAILAIDAAVVLATASWAGALRGSGRFGVVFVASVIQVGVALPLLVVLLPAIGLPGAAVAQLAGRLAGRATLGLALARSAPWFRVVPPRPSRGRLIGVFGFSVPIFLMQLGTQLGSGTDVIIIGAAYGATTAGLYAVGSQLVRFAAYLVFPLIDVVYPRLATLDVHSPTAGRAVLVRSLFLGAIVGAVAFGGLALEADAILLAWTGADAALSAAVLVLYAIAYVIITPAHILVLALIARGQHRTVAVVILVEAIVNVCLSIALALAIGPIGPAISTLLVVLVDDVLIIPIVAARRLGVSLRTLLVPALAGVVVGAAVLLPSRLVPGESATSLVIRGAISVVLLAVVVAIGLRRPLAPSMMVDESRLDEARTAAGPVPRG